MVKAKQIDAPLLEREQIQAQVKPLSNNGFKRFFQKIGRGWLTAWYGFSDRRPGFSKLLYTAFFFIAFSYPLKRFPGGNINLPGLGVCP